MFRLSQYMQELIRPTPVRRHQPPGPVVIWNLVRRCNLNCIHCYSISADTDFPGELPTAEVFAVMDDLKAFGVPVLILFGGEPLLRRDIFAISARAKALGFYVGLSSNGTLIDEACAERIGAIGYDYVGVSLDGIGEVHDRFRRQAGSYGAALGGLRLCRERGIKVGLRFTMTERNAHHLEAMLDLMEAIDKFYLSPSALRRPRQPPPRRRCLPPHHARRHEPCLRALLVPGPRRPPHRVRDRQQRR